MSVDSIGGTTVILGSSDIATLFGTPLNSGGTATFSAVLGDVANSSVAARLTSLAQQTTRTVTAKSVASVTTANLFTISGGPVRILALAGYVTTGIQAAANNAKIQFTPTGGAASDVCSTGDVTGIAARTWLGVPLYDVSQVLQVGTSAVGWIQSQVSGKESASGIFFTGTLSMNCSATTTGAITWYIEYEPLAPGAAVAAA